MLIIRFKPALAFKSIKSFEMCCVEPNTDHFQLKWLLPKNWMNFEQKLDSSFENCVIAFIPWQIERVKFNDFSCKWYVMTVFGVVVCVQRNRLLL